MIRPLLRGALACALAAAPLAPLPTWAAPPRDEASIQQVLKTATAAFKAGRHAEALARFQSVEADIVARGDFAAYRWNLARCFESLGRWAEAVAAYDHYLTLPDAPKNQAEGRARRQALLDAHFGRLMITCDVSGATVSLLGGPRRGATPAHTAGCPADWGPLPEGPVRVEARSPGGVVHTLSERITAGRTTRLAVEFPALLTVAGPPGAAVLIDDAPVGAVPVEARAVPPGWRRVVVEAPGQLPWQTRVQVIAGAHLSLDASAPPPEAASAPTWPAWAASAGALALLGAGVGFYFAAAEANSRAEDEASAYNANPDPARRAATDARIAGHVDDFELYRTLTYTSLGLGVAAAGAATWLFLSSEDGLAVVPTAQGLALVGAW